MKKLFLALILVMITAVIFNGCVIFQKTLNVTGSWRFTWDRLSTQRAELPSFLTSSHIHHTRDGSCCHETRQQEPSLVFCVTSSDARATDYANVDIKQNGTAISGTWHGQVDLAIIGTINTDDRITFSLTLDGVECEIEGQVTGEKSLFKKEGQTITGLMRFKYLNHVASTDFTATRN